MQTVQTWYGDLNEASANRIVISNGFKKGIYEGNFTYSSGDISGGVLNRFTQFDGNSASIVASDFSVAATAAATLIDASDLRTLFSVVRKRGKSCGEGALAPSQMVTGLIPSAHGPSR